MTGMENHIGTRESRPPRAPQDQDNVTVIKDIENYGQAMKVATVFIRQMLEHRAAHVQEKLIKPDSGCIFCKNASAERIAV